MKVYIVHDSKFGNGKIVASTLAAAFKEAEITIGHIKKISPNLVTQNPPDLIIIGTAVRIFRISRASRKWLKKLHKSLDNQGQQINFGAGFVTHMRDIDKVSSRVEGFYNLLQDTSPIQNVFPNWITAQVADVEGPLKKGVIDKIRFQGIEIRDWIHKKEETLLLN